MQDFLSFLSDLRRGQAIEEYRQALVDLERSVRETGKPGSLTLTLTLKPVGKGMDAFEIKDAFTAKMPIGEKGTTLLFADDAGRMSRRDPRQPQLPTMRDVNARPEDAEGAAVNE